MERAERKKVARKNDSSSSSETKQKKARIAAKFDAADDDEAIQVYQAPRISKKATNIVRSSALPHRFRSRWMPEWINGIDNWLKEVTVVSKFKIKFEECAKISFPSTKTSSDVNANSNCDRIEMSIWAKFLDPYLQKRYAALKYNKRLEKFTCHPGCTDPKCDKQFGIVVSKVDEREDETKLLNARKLEWYVDVNSESCEVKTEAQIETDAQKLIRLYKNPHLLGIVPFNLWVDVISRIIKLTTGIDHHFHIEELDIDDDIKYAKHTTGFNLWYLKPGHSIFGEDVGNTGTSVGSGRSACTKISPRDVHLSLTGKWMRCSVNKRAQRDGGGLFLFTKKHSRLAYEETRAYTAYNLALRMLAGSGHFAETRIEAWRKYLMAGSSSTFCNQLGVETKEGEIRFGRLRNGRTLKFLADKDYYYQRIITHAIGNNVSFELYLSEDRLQLTIIDTGVQVYKYTENRGIEGDLFKCVEQRKDKPETTIPQDNLEDKFPAAISDNNNGIYEPGITVPVRQGVNLRKEGLAFETFCNSQFTADLVLFLKCYLLTMLEFDPRAVAKKLRQAPNNSTTCSLSSNSGNQYSDPTLEQLEDSTTLGSTLSDRLKNRDVSARQVLATLPTAVFNIAKDYFDMPELRWENIYDSLIKTGKLEVLLSPKTPTREPSLPRDIFPAFDVVELDEAK